MRHTYLVALAALVLLLPGCPSRERISPSEPEETDTFVYGPPRVVQLTGTPGEAVPDTASGTTFVFPEGASGALTLIPLLQGPEPPFPGGAGLLLEAPAGAHVQLRLTVGSADEVANVYVFGRAQGCLDGGGPRSARWVSVPDQVRSGDIVTFDLPAPTPSKQGTGLILWQSASYMSGMGRVTMAAINDIRAAVDALPEPLRTRVRADWDGDLRCDFLQSSETEGSYYTGFGWYFPSYVVPRIALRLTSSDDVIAHETGHFLSHLIGGSAAYRIIESKAPDENHGLAVLYDGRQTITEEYAYFTQFFHLDQVNSGDPRIGGWLSGISRRTPTDVDYPSLEGFGCSLMAACTREAAADVYDFTRQRYPTPAGGLTKGDVLALFAQGANDINTLAGALGTAMTTAGRGDAYRVIAERMGWSYHGRGIVLMPNNSPCANATVQAEITVDGVRYVTPVATSGVDGKYVLPRIFPGAFILRVIKGTQGAEMRFEVPWTHVTTEEIELPDIQLQLATNTVVAAITYTDPVSFPEPRISSSGSVSVSGIQPTIQRNADGNYSAAVLKDSPCTVVYHLAHTWSPTNVYTTSHPDGSRTELTYENLSYDPDNSILVSTTGQVPTTVSVAGDNLSVQFTLTQDRQKVWVNATVEVSVTVRSYDPLGNLTDTRTEVVNHRTINITSVEAAMP